MNCANYAPYAILKVPNFALEVFYKRFTCIQGRKILIIYIAAQCLQQFDKGLNLSKPLISKSLPCSDCSDVPVCCDWSTLQQMLETKQPLNSMNRYEHIFIVSIRVLIFWRCIQSGFSVDVVHRQPMKTHIGWKCENLFQTHVMQEVRLELLTSL